MNFGEYVNAAGYTKTMTSDPKKYYLPTDSLIFFSKFGGKAIDQMYQKIGTQDPLITVAPNILRTPSFNVYPVDNLNRTLLPESMGNLENYYATNIEAPVAKHFAEPFDRENYHAQRFVDLVFPNVKNNPLFNEEAEYMRQLEKVLSTVSKNNETNKEKYVAPFDKCNPVLKEHIARFVCDKLLLLMKDNNDDFINTGYFNIAVGLGARYNIPKIQQLIKSLTPEKHGIDMTNINEIKDYIKESAFYIEMMATNRYLALASTVNMMFNNSDMSRIGLYANENSPYMVACKNAIKNRDYLPPNVNRLFIKSLSNTYYSLHTNPDRLYFATRQDEKNLESICQMLTNTFR